MTNDVQCVCGKVFLNRRDQPLDEQAVSQHRLKCHEHLTSLRRKVVSIGSTRFRARKRLKVAHEPEPLTTSTLETHTNHSEASSSSANTVHSSEYGSFHEPTADSGLPPNSENNISVSGGALAPTNNDQTHASIDPPNVKRTRVGRVIRPTAKLRDVAPEPPPPPAEDPPHVPTEEPTSQSDAIPPAPSTVYTTSDSVFGVFREYYSRPSHSEFFQNTSLSSELPGQEIEPNDSTQPSSSSGTTEQPAPSGSLTHIPTPREQNEAIQKLIHPFPSYSIFLYLKHDYEGEIKSRENRDRQVSDVFLHKDFCYDEFRPYLERLNRIEADLDSLDSSIEHSLGSADGWHASSIILQVPLPKIRGVVDTGIRSISVTIPNLQHRSIVAVVREALVRKRKPSTGLHYIPYRQFAKRPLRQNPDHVERLVDDLYTADAWWKEHDVIQKNTELLSDGNPCTLPRAIAGLCWWSDATQLANFGTSKLWPLYMFLGNQAKYLREKPSASCCHHIAYLPSLPDSVQDTIKRVSADGKVPRSALLTYLRRELMHRIWDLLLDDEFLDAWDHGIVVDCGDGIRRRIYIRIFTYSADYPEKALLITIRENGTCPCVWCTITKDLIHLMGTKRDLKNREVLARHDTVERQGRVKKAIHYIENEAKAVNSSAVEDLLKKDSSVPIVNAFSEKLSSRGFNFYDMMMPDVMHEFDLGNWSGLFKHLIRLLYAIVPDAVAVLNERYRSVPTYGDTIRKFNNNAAETKNMAARDYEDLLQCAIPVFLGLFPEPINAIVRGVLFVAAQWQFLAKLHMHSSSTVRALENCTTEYGTLIRRFCRMTKDYNTVETGAEVRARKRKAKPPKNGSEANQEPPSGPKERKLNINTVKFHNMAHVVLAIPHKGTTDGWSTRRGEVEHRRVKRLYKLTNFRNFEGQIARRIRRMEQMAKIQHKVALYKGEVARLRKQHQKTPDSSAEPTGETLTDQVSSPAETNSLLEFLPDPTDDVADTPNTRYHMADSMKDYLNIVLFQREAIFDVAEKSFVHELKDHILCRIRDVSPNDDYSFSDLERSVIQFRKDRIYHHSTFQIHYTTYDLRRAQDSIGINSDHRDIMVNSADVNHPFWYARVHQIFHAFVMHPRQKDTKGDRMDFLFVRWFGLDPNSRGGWKRRELDRVGFIENEEAFGFVDPSQVVRGCHLIPAFELGRTHALINGPSKFKDKHRDGEWQFYYVDRFVDSDMAMRYTNYGIGHVHQHSGGEMMMGDWNGRAENWSERLEEADDEEELNLPDGNTSDPETNDSRGDDDTEEESDDSGDGEL